MKRTLSLIFAAMMALSVFSSCKDDSKAYVIAYSEHKNSLGLSGDVATVYSSFLEECSAAVVNMQQSWITLNADDSVAKAQFDNACAKVEAVFTKYKPLIAQCTGTGMIDYYRAFELFVNESSATDPIATHKYTLTYENIPE